jgi:hypothetical protein
MEELQEYIKKYPEKIQSLFSELRRLILQSVSEEVEERLWAKIPSFYLSERFIRIIPFKDHVNVEAGAIIEHKHELGQYKLTPKGMLQLYPGQTIPEEVLRSAFTKTLQG